MIGLTMRVVSRNAFSSRLAWSVLALVAAGACEPGALRSPEGSPPHVVLIVADDLGWSDVGYHGSAIGTPNIDRIAREGVALERFYVSPICSPTRAALLTGRYPIRYGLSRAVVAPWRDFGLDPAETTLPQVLGRAGYRHRALFGKWHLGHLRAQWHPLARGFTHFHGHYNGAVDYFQHTREGERDWHLGWEPLVEEGYTTDLISGAAAQFIQEHASEGPLLVTVAFNAPHPPFQAPVESLAAYDEMRGEDGQPSLRQVRAAMVTSMDDGIGRILAALEQAGIADDTLVWLMSDNGGTGADSEDNLPWRGNKHDLFEGGIRVPACVRWPRGLPSGAVLDAPTAVQDVLPTLMRIAGVSDHQGLPLDGVDVLDVLRGTRLELERELYFYFGQDGEEREKLAVVQLPWKLVILGPSLAEDSLDDRHQRLLFDLAADPRESVDVSADHPTLVEELTRELVEFRRLQPESSIATYEQGREGFVAPPSWRLDPSR